MKYKLILSDTVGNSVDLYSDPNIRIISTDGIGFSSDVHTMKLYGFDDTLFQGCDLQQRIITLTAQYYGNYAQTDEQAKNRLMRVIGNKLLLRLRYVTDNIDVYIQCRTEQVSTPPNTYPMVTQISLICPDPYWRKSGDNSVVIAGLIPLFEFIIGIPQSGMEFGEIRSGRITDLYNGGTVESGALFTITANQPCTNPKLLNLRTEQFIQISVAMDAGDVLEICTEQGKRSVWFTHNGVRRNYFSRRTKGSEFFQLVCGNNPIKYSVDSGGDRAVDIVCKFDTKYGGI